MASFGPTFIWHLNSTRPAHPSRGILVLLALAALVTALVPQQASAKPSCHGKRATIVSNKGTIVGTKGPNVIVAGGADNVIYGEGGNDLICGGGGDDAIHGVRGKDDLYGEAGDDTLFGERGSDDLDGGAGVDAVLGESGNDGVDGGDGDGDHVNGGPGDDTLRGGPGDFDVLVGAPGNDKVDGGPGQHDVASYANSGGAVTINLQSQSVGGAEAENLSGIEDALGGSGPDNLIGDGNANRLDGGPGNDNLAAAGPGDEAYGGPGSDGCGVGFAGEASCGPSQGATGTAVELYQSIDGQTSLIVTGGGNGDAATVAFAGGAFVVQGPAVVLGDPASPVCVQGAGSVSCQGRTGSILAALDGGNDSFTVDASVPSSVNSIIDGGKGSDALRAGKGDDVVFAGDDHDPDSLEGGGGHDVLYGVNIFHPRKDSGKATMLGGPGSDLLIGGQPCDGDLFDGGPGPNDSASFARVRNGGIFVRATIGGAVVDPDVGGCQGGQIDNSIEKIEGSTGRDVLDGDGTANVLLGRGGNDDLDGQGGNDGCVGGGGRDQAVRCEQESSVP
jgi:Ca2+-binding RTX toxin-like protein